MKAALYIRVSTQEQALEGYSLDAQQEKLINYANYQKYEIVGSYRDEGFSASSMHRPALLKMIKEIELGKIDIVLIYKLDRLSRRVRDVLELVDLFNDYKVTLYSLTENLDLSSPFGRAALKMSATFSELERETIIERSKLGKDQRVKEGKMMCTGKAPFGYKHIKAEGRFEVVPEEAEIVQKLFELYLDGYSFRKLYQYGKEKTGNPYFSNEMCCKPIIHRSMYSGYFTWKGQLYKGVNFAPIIPYEVYLKAQKQMKKNLTVRKHDNSPYLLTGLVLCARCGNRYVGKLYDRYVTKADGSTGKHYKYTAYGCAARVKRDKKYSPTFCDNTIFNAQELEQMISEKVKNLQFSKFVDGEFASGVVDELISSNTVLRGKIDKLLDLYMSELIDKATYQQRVGEYEDEINKNKIIIDNETENASASPTTSVDYMLRAQQNYDNLNKHEKKKLLINLIKYISVDGENVVIKWKVE